MLQTRDGEMIILTRHFVLFASSGITKGSLLLTFYNYKIEEIECKFSYDC